MNLLGNLAEYTKGLGSALLLLVVMYGGLWIKKVFEQKRKNTLNEIDLSAKKISLDNQSKPIDALVSESNSKHGIRENEVVEPARSDDKKGK